jgi:YD repeat-containing protein
LSRKDNLNRFTALIDSTSASVQLQKLTYTYDATSNPVGILDGSGVFLAYGYDSKDRVTTAVYTQGVSVSTFSYGYDGVDNKILDTFPQVVTTVYNLSGQIVTAMDAGVLTTYTYDLNGNNTGIAKPGQLVTMSYDKENRLTVYKEGATTATYAYDGDGIKRSENKGTGITTLVWDGTDYLGEVTGGSMTTRFYTIGSQMLAYEKAGTRKDFLFDMLGSITAEVDQTQNRTYESRYSAYGRNNWSTGTGCGFGWVGSYGYRETGTFFNSHYVRARHYSYVSGLWSTVDPLWPDESAYGYVGARATLTRDPMGTAPGGPGSNFGSCAIFVCTEHTFGSGIWGILPSHQFVCVRGPHGGCSGGNYPGGIGNGSEGCSSKNPPKPGDTCTKVSVDCDLANLICGCIRVAATSGYPYTFVGMNCMTFPNEMFDCACRVLRAAGRISPGCLGFNPTISPPHVYPPETLIGPPYRG